MADSARQRPSRCNLVPMMKLFIAVLIGPTHLCTASERPRVRLVVKDLVDASAGTGSGCIAPASLCRIAALPVGGYLTSTFAAALQKCRTPRAPRRSHSCSRCPERRRTFRMPWSCRSEYSRRRTCRPRRPKSNHAGRHRTAVGKAFPTWLWNTPLPAV